MRDRLDEALKVTEPKPGATASRELEADLLQLGVDLAEVGIVV